MKKEVIQESGELEKFPYSKSYPFLPAVPTIPEYKTLLNVNDKDGTCVLELKQNGDIIHMGNFIINNQEMAKSLSAKGELYSLLVKSTADKAITILNAIEEELFSVSNSGEVMSDGIFMFSDPDLVDCIRNS